MDDEDLYTYTTERLEISRKFLKLQLKSLQNSLFLKLDDEHSREFSRSRNSFNLKFEVFEDDHQKKTAFELNFPNISKWQFF